MTRVAPGTYAAAQFADVGHTLTYVQNEPVRLPGRRRPVHDSASRTPPANAYWSLWWSDGTSGTWTYSVGGRRLAQGARRWVRRAVVAEGHRPGDAGRGADLPPAVVARRPTRPRRHRALPPRPPTSKPTPRPGASTVLGHLVGAGTRPPPGRRARPARPRRRTRHALTPSAGPTAERARRRAATYHVGHRGGQPSRRAPRRRPRAGLPGWVAPVLVARPVRRGRRRGRRTTETRRRLLMRGPPRDRPPPAGPAPGRLVAVGGRAGRRARRSPPTRGCC